ncbi:hypothetical protein HYW55_05435 [Candidatus Gottesmanbacteria bacterium]|nr:hypothetical protein [Candidatus Gottesmanbacteria bacterium]
MSTKSWVMIGLIIGSLIGGYIPVFFGASLLSFSSLFGNAIGGILGIVVAYKLFNDLG